VQSLQVIGVADPRMRRIHYDWLDAAERTQATVRLLSEQLRRFLDDQVWLENRRVMDILRDIEAHALAVRDHPTNDLVGELDAAAPHVVLPMERPMYRPRAKQPLDSTVDSADADADVDVSRLFEQVFVDPLRLTDAVRGALHRRSQVSLAEVLAARPLEQGLAELVTYLSLRDPGFDVVFDEDGRDQVRWCDAEGRMRSASLPAVSFVRKVPALDGA
jgi:Protein of unknown function (DUF3375)